jgi:serine/threonine protein phosphatase PrpC
MHEFVQQTPMSLDLDIGYASERGPREVNEDFVATRRPAPQEEDMGFICAIADGGSAGGDGRMASQTSAKSLVEDYFGAPQTWRSNTVLDRLIVAQNSWLAAHNRRHANSTTSTLTALVLRGQHWTVAHVGDTRAYLMRGGECTLLTQDHCLAQTESGRQLTRALGQDDAIRVDYEQGDLQRGDAFVLLSDGVYTKLAHPRIAWLAAQGSAGLASNSLVAAALAAGSEDNASALVIRVHGLASPRLGDASHNDWQSGESFEPLHGPPRRDAAACEPILRVPTAEEPAPALQPGAARPLPAAGETPLATRDPVALWKLGAWLSVALNVMLICWLLFVSR